MCNLKMIISLGSTLKFNKFKLAESDLSFFLKIPKILPWPKYRAHVPVAHQKCAENLGIGVVLGHEVKGRYNTIGDGGLIEQ